MVELYFCLVLTENEHGVVEGRLAARAALGCEVRYYRELKDGHIPLYREVKVTGPREGVNRLKAWMRGEKLDKYVEPNPHRAAATN